jgi:hypothetical protein
LAAKEHKARKKGERYKGFSMCALRFFGAEILFKMQNEPQMDADGRGFLACGNPR